MHTQNNNEKCTYGIEKFEGTFDKEEIGVTIIPNKTINDIRNPEALGVYVYLLARPTGWKLNTKQLSAHFQCGKEKMLRILNWLLEEKFIACTMIRQNGRFTKPHYRVFLSRLNTRPNHENLDEAQYQQDFSPQTGFPATVTPDTVNPTAYKTKTSLSIEKDKDPIVSKETAGMFMLFWSLYPVKKARKQCELKWKRLNLDAKAEIILPALKNQIANDDQWKRGFVPNPLTYINGELWNDEIVKTKPQGKSNNERICII